MTRPKSSPWTAGPSPAKLYNLSSEWPRTLGLGASLPGRLSHWLQARPDYPLP